MFYLQRITVYEGEYKILCEKYNFWRVVRLYSPINKIKNEMGRNRFYVYSRRLHREVRLYNSLQYDYWVLTESDTTVMSYCERPLKIKVSIAGKIVETVLFMSNKKFLRDFNEHISECIKSDSDFIHMYKTRLLCICFKEHVLVNFGNQLYIDINFPTKMTQNTPVRYMFPRCSVKIKY